MYVSPESGGKGVGKELVRKAIDGANGLGGLNHLNLTVMATNSRAIRLYESAGFVRFAVEPNAVEHQGRFVDEWQMQRSLV